MAKTRITIWHEMDPEEDYSYWHMDKICKELEKENDVQIDLVFKEFVNFIKGIQNIHNIEEKPDIVLIPQDMVNMEYAEYSDIPEEISKYMEKDVFDSMKYKGVQKAIPFVQGNEGLLFYNKKYFSKKPESWEKICALDIEGVTPLAVDLEERYWILPFLYTFSEGPMDEINKAGEEKAVEFLRKNLESKKVISVSGMGDMQEKFLSGEVAAIINGEWKLPFLYEKMGEDLGVSMLPTIESKQMITTAATFGISFPLDSLNGEKKEFMHTFIKKMLSDQVQEQWYKEFHRLPVKQTIIDAMVEAKDKSEMYEAYKQMKASVNLNNEECQGEYWLRCDRVMEQCLGKKVSGLKN